MLGKPEIETVQRKYCSIRWLNPIGYEGFFANEGTKGYEYLSFFTLTVSGKSMDSVQKGAGVVGVVKMQIGGIDGHVQQQADSDR
jgi:hypothetical protein